VGEEEDALEKEVIRTTKVRSLSLSLSLSFFLEARMREKINEGKEGAPIP